jgi:cytochrome c oxidase subunit 2
LRQTLMVLALPALASAALLLSSCGGNDENEQAGTTTAATNAKNITITAKDFSFDNVNLSAKAGEPVHLTLKNTGSAEHSFTIKDVVDTEAEGGETKTADFTSPSQTTEFHCRYHPTQMKGTLTIGQSDGTGGSSGGSSGGY